jgi:uncharacterized protein (TIGR02217 family)
LGYQANPNYSVTISTAASGIEHRNRNWLRPLSTYAFTIGPSSDDELVEELIEFWHAMGGTECGFRFRDYSDFKSCRKLRTPTRLDQLVIPNPDSPGGYQLQKAYTFGTRTQSRDILKPIQGTILVADNGVLKTEGAHYMLDYATGLLTLSFSPAGLLTWGGEFDVPVRFDSDFPVEIQQARVESVSFQLRELRVAELED